MVVVVVMMIVASCHLLCGGSCSLSWCLHDVVKERLEYRSMMRIGLASTNCYDTPRWSERSFWSR
jgi:hypothetical protein